MLVFGKEERATVKQGDIIGYRCAPDEMTKVHRVMQMQPEKKENFAFTLKGDNAFDHESPEKGFEVVGRLHYVFRGEQLIDYNLPLRRGLGCVFARISKWNLLPELIKRRLGRLFLDPLRESKTVISITRLFSGSELKVHHFQRQEKGYLKEGDFSLQRGSMPVGGLHYRNGEWRTQPAAFVQNFWLRFPFSYRVLFMQLIKRAEEEWQQAGIKQAVFPFRLERKMISNALTDAGYRQLQSEEDGALGFIKEL